MKKLLLLLLCISFGLLNAQQTVEIPIIDGNDDAFQYRFDGKMFVDTIALSMGHTFEPSIDYVTGLRYQTVPIPPGSTIESAYIQFTPFESNEEIHIVWIFGERNTNPPAFTTEDFNITDREKLYPEEQWGVSEWQAWIPNDNSKTHNLNNIVQNLIDLEGWQMNNPIVFLLYGTDTHGALLPKSASSYEYGAEWYAPLLTITFTAPATVSEQKLAKALNIFPNPVSEKFTVSLKDINRGTYTISLFDLQGRKLHEVFNGLLPVGDHQYKLSADELNLEQAIYLLRVHSSTGDISRKIVVH